MRWIVFGLVCLLVPLAGCAGPSDTAKSLYPKARAAALDWQPDAFLIKIGAVESKVGNDTRPGDGHAPGWGFVFSSNRTTKEFHAYAPSTGELVTGEYGSSQASPGRTEMALNWKVDSDRASDLAAAANATFRTLRGQEGTIAAWGLDAGDGAGHPFWLLLAMTQVNGQQGVYLVVDANNGTVYTDRPLIDWDFNFNLSVNFTALGWEVRESGTTAGRLTAVEPSLRSAFSLNSTHGTLALAVRGGDLELPGQRIRVFVLAPTGGPPIELEHTNDLTPGRVDHVKLGSMPDGKYNVTIELAALGPDSLATDFEFSWCTDGADFSVNLSGGQAPAACDFVL